MPSVSRIPNETIILDDDTDILTIRRGNETRFQRLSSRPFLGSAKYTSTPEDKPYQNGTSDDDDIILVKESRVGSTATAPRAAKTSQKSLLGSGLSYLKPFTGASYLKSLQQNGRPKENVRPKLTENVPKKSGRRPTFGSLEYSIRLDDKIQYKKLLEKAAKNESNDSSIYGTPIGKLFNYDTANTTLTRTDKILSMATDGRLDKNEPSKCCLNCLFCLKQNHFDCFKIMFKTISKHYLPKR